MRSNKRRGEDIMGKATEARATGAAVNVILWAAAGGDMNEREQAEGWSERWVVDGLEDSPRGRLARVELPSGHTRTIPLHELPDGVREGDLLEVRAGVGGLVFRRLEAETLAARLQAQLRLEQLNAGEGRQGPLTINDDGEIEL
ncbi:DUF3006 domain-containing protein [Deinococcus radiodurans]|jgi:Protein of unknown function (DUF3006).|uniref:DUF3006 domain-containing protein n=1 Tax=Deinococcus radiodurans (strain ATCC 13939 / DSM 20539 / JCM 16871 / CCUG 27074 / LMG 4051 / NBRC 15346 / NCIMB 9279 / VKM B-1422 / R1) TaxID=243230 RepID=Q9RXF3_DEIRA|nr:DUF3006 domain-containing protein [Deinococcus radiodurans]AAF09947.1 hypothetical protein DR_0360 [Deinococcus radiodurans R1 = ATCC 13939 = DSM 20539]ANC72385.1 hypothetical protein A2G07_11735 [Deinococcus radiodurans R1 = ATCC 13939 = DSM 20539]QEM72316.1 DUF3006 domain-containing protein [Deinococcus radiodurans]UDK99550.1 DUF3006 domain-containing protein [Deinococcus radiodurans R1 = ATCC 13939 = DSM 20539]UID69365.1 hypothetical protein DRO_0359 [Deinococcus radiodurans R1 = ATCC 13